MKLLQWNIWYKEDIKNILTLLKEADADIICLQELTINHPECNQGIDTPKFIAEGLGFNYYFKDAQANIQDGHERVIGNGIFSRFPILEPNFYYIQKPHDPNDQIIDYSTEGRVYIETLLDTPEGKYRIGTVHMSYTHKFSQTPAKDTEARELIKAIQDKNERYILTGDFNALPNFYTITKLQERLKNAGPKLQENTWTTKPFSYKGFEAHALDWRIDYCFTTHDIRVLSCEILKTEFSDHLPLLLTF